MNNTLRKFLLTIGAVFLVSFGARDVLAQFPSGIGGPYSVDSATVALLHFNGADSNMVMSHSSIPTIDTLSVFEERDSTVKFPHMSAMPSLGGSIYIEQNQSDVDNSIYNFARIRNKNRVFQLPDDQTIQFWFKLAGRHGDRHKLVWKPGGSPGTGNQSFFLNNFVAEYVGDGEAKVQFHSPDPNGPNEKPSGGWLDIVYDSGIEVDKWYHYTYVRDDSDSTLTAAIYNTSGQLVGSAHESWKGQIKFADADTVNGDQPVYLGVNPSWNADRCLTCVDDWGGAGSQQFWGNLDEIRISNVARKLVVPIFAKGTPNLWDKGLQSPIDSTQTFALNVRWNDAVEDSGTIKFHYNWGSGWQTKKMTNVDSTRYKVTTMNAPGGTTYRYYVSAHMNGEQKGRFPNGGNIAEFDVQFLPQTVLKLSFEEGDDMVAPFDSSNFNYKVDIVGDTTYSGEAIDGTWSYELNGNTDLAVRNGPATGSFDITVDFWFKATQMPADSARLIAHENPDDSSSVNYSVFFKDSSLHARATGSGDVELSDHDIQTGKWYRAVYMISASAHSLQLWDNNGNLVTHDVEEINGKPAKDQDGTLFIGQGNFNTGSQFIGLVDKIEITNFTSVTGPFIAENVTQYVSMPDTVSEYPINVHIPHAGKGTVNARLHYKGQFGWTFLEMDKKENSATYTKPITAQSGKTSVPYFVEVKEGPYSAVLPAGATASDTSANYHFGVYKLHTKVLDVDFEKYKQNTSEVIPVDKSDYSKFNEASIESAGPNKKPIKSTDAPQGKYSFNFTRQDTSSLEFSSDFLATDEITISMWFKFSSFDPDHVGNGTFSYWQTILMLAKHHPGDWQVNNHYALGVLNKPYSGQPQTLNGRSMTENSGTRAIHDGLDMDSSLVTGKWYRAVYEYSLNDTAFTQLYNKQGELIEEVGMKTTGFGPQLKGDNPLAIGSYFLNSSKIFGGNLFSGWIDNVEIYNYAARTKPPTVSEVADLDSISTNADPQSITATVDRNGDEPVYLVWRVQSSAGTTAWDSTEMSVDFTGTNYSANLPTQDAGKAVEYFVTTRNDFGVTASSDMERVVFHRDQPGNTLVLDFESGEDIKDKSPYQWMVKRTGKLASTPAFTKDAVQGNYALEFQAEDSTYLKIDAPYPFLNHSNFTVDLWFKSNREDNANVRLLGKPGTDADSLAWWQQNFELKGIGGGSWTAGGYMADTTLDFGNRFIINRLDDEDAFGGQGTKDALEDSTWYHLRYIQDIANDSVHAAITTTDGSTVVKSSFEIPGDMNMAPVKTHGPLVIGHAGPEGQRYFDGVIDHLRIRSTIPDVLDVPSKRGNDLPDKFSLGNNYPNPFNPTTTINYALPKSTDVTLKVYNLLGREVATLVNSKQKAGRHQVKFDAGHLASGVYFYRIETPEFNKVRKMMLIK